MLAKEKGAIKGVIFANEEGGQYEEDNGWLDGGS
jgi:hypothetical protein